MTLEVKHPFTDLKPDGGDTTVVRPSDWNANHPIRMSPGVVGRTDSGDGLATVLPASGAGNVVLESAKRIYPFGTEITANLAGSITVTGPHHTVDTYNDGANSIIYSILGGTDGMVVTFRPASGNRSITFHHEYPSANQLSLANGDCTLSQMFHSLTLMYVASLSHWIEIARSVQPREFLSAGRFLRVRWGLGIATITIGTPTLVTLTAPHNLVAGDPVVFHLPYDASDNGYGLAPTISIDSPGVLNFGELHGYADNDPIRLYFTRTPPGGLAADTLYFVRNSTSTTFELSLTSGGASINTTGAFTGYMKVERWSLLPTGNEIIEGKPYFVIAAGLTSTAFRFSETLGGAAVNTTGTQRGKVTVQTGNDNNAGYPTDSQADALLTPQRAFEIACDLDNNDFGVGISLAESKYRTVDAAVLGCYRAYPAYVPESPGEANTPIGGGRIYIEGSPYHRSNVVFQAINYHCIETIGDFDNFIHWREITFQGDPDSGYWDAVHLTSGETPYYVDHVAYRPPFGSMVGCYGAHTYLHGMHEIIGNAEGAYGPDYNWSAFHCSNGSLTYITPGGNYWPGCIAFGTQNIPQLLGCEGDGKLNINGLNQFEGDFDCPWARVWEGGIVAVEATTDYVTSLPSPATSVTAMGTEAVNEGGTIRIQNYDDNHYVGRSASDYWETIPRLVADLLPAGQVGRRALVTDAVVPFGTLAGGGSYPAALIDDGDAWRFENQSRERLSAATGRYLRYNLGRCAMTIGANATVTMYDSSAHGLQIGDPVVFSLPYDMPTIEVLEVSITIDSPGVVTVNPWGDYTEHGLNNDDPIALRTTGELPTGLTASTSAALQRYYVRNKTSLSFELSETPGGASIDTSDTQSGKHTFERASWLPTGVVDGQVFYVIASGFTSTSFRFSTTPGGAAVTTSGTQAGKITLQTGNDANDGLTTGRAGALLHVSEVLRHVEKLDLNGRIFSVIVAEGTYLPNPSDSSQNDRNKSIFTYFHPRTESGGDGRIAGEGTSVGGGYLQFLGAGFNRLSQVVFRTIDSYCLNLNGPLPWELQIRYVTWDTQHTSHWNLFNVAFPLHFRGDYAFYRGTPSLYSVAYGINAFVKYHGFHALFCAPTSTFAEFYNYEATNDAGFNYSEAGESGRNEGIMAFEPQTYFSFWYLEGRARGQQLAQGNLIDAGFDNPPGPWVWAEEQSDFTTTLTNFGVFRQTELPGGVQINSGSTLKAGDWGFPDGLSRLMYVITPDHYTIRLAADFDKVDSTLANVTGFEIPLVQSGIKYAIDATLYTTSDVAAGIKFALNGGATVSGLILEAVVTQGTSIVVNERGSALAAAFGDITAVTTATVKLTGSFISTSTHGMIRLQFAQNVTNATASKILAGSTFSIRPIT